MPSYRSIANTTYAARVNTTVNVPAGVVDGDLLIFILDVKISGTPPVPTKPSGWNDVNGFPTAQFGNAGFNAKVYAWWRVAASEPANYTATHTSASTQGYIVAVQAPFNLSNPFQPTPTTNTGIGVTTTALGLTTIADGDLVLYLASDWGTTANNLTAPTGTTPTFTERLDIAPLSYVASGNLATAGATSNKTQTNNSSAADPWFGSLIAITGISEEQEGARFRNDDGDEATATWKDVQDANVIMAPLDNARVRVIVNATGNPPAGSYRLEWRKVGDSTWRSVDA